MKDLGKELNAKKNAHLFELYDNNVDTFEITYMDCVEIGDKLNLLLSKQKDNISKNFESDIQLPIMDYYIENVEFDNDINRIIAIYNNKVKKMKKFLNKMKIISLKIDLDEERRKSMTNVEKFTAQNCLIFCRVPGSS